MFIKWILVNFVQIFNHFHHFVESNQNFWNAGMDLEFERF